MKRQRWKDMAAVFVILFLLPYVVTVLAAGVPSEGGGQKAKSRQQVTVAGDGYEKTISVNEYLTGALAAQIPINYEQEVMKAQAVLVRTNFELYEKEAEILSEDTRYQPYLDKNQLKELWGEEYEKNYAKLEMAVTDSGGQCIFYNDQLARPYYHAISAGTTRSGKEVFGDDAYGYLAPVECGKDITAQNYVTIKCFTAQELSEVLKQYYDGAQEATPGAVVQWFQEAETDSEGYVLTLDFAGEKVHAETIRTQFGLPSSCFVTEVWEDGMRFVCKGRGHGLGMSLYYADQLAKKGKSYKEILQYFFHDITIKEAVSE